MRKRGQEGCTGKTENGLIIYCRPTAQEIRGHVRADTARRDPGVRIGPGASRPSMRAELAWPYTSPRTLPSWSHGGHAPDSNALSPSLLHRCILVAVDTANPQPFFFLSGYVGFLSVSVDCYRDRRRDGDASHLGISLSGRRLFHPLFDFGARAGLSFRNKNAYVFAFLLAHSPGPESLEKSGYYCRIT